MLDSNPQIGALEALLGRIIRVGNVSARYPGEGAVQVDFRDAGAEGVASWRCPVLFAKTKADKAYWMPDIGERVVVLSLPQGKELGVVIGAFYNDRDAVPVESGDRAHARFEDGTTVEYDRNSHTLAVNAVGAVTIECAGDATIKTEGDALVEAAGPTTVRGNQVKIDGGGGATGKALVYPKALSDFTGKPVQPPSSTIEASL